jgi:hypothetical protein
MERVHRIFSNNDQIFKAALDRAGIAHKCEESIVGKLVLLLISESDLHWPQVEKLLTAHDVFHAVEKRFTVAEVAAASWCTLGVTSHFGYPQPEGDFGYRRTTYEPVGCMQCGIGFIQAGPFRFRSTPTQRRSQMIQLNWVFDEFFVSAQARAHLEAAIITGIQFCSPVIHKSGQSVSGWFQMQVLNTLEPIIAVDSFVTETCPVCHNRKFHYPQTQALELLRKLPDFSADVIKTAEWFGSGGEAHKLVLVSRRFTQLVLERHWRGVSLEPITLDF